MTELVDASRAAHDKQRRRRRGLVWSAFAALAAIAVIATVAVIARYQAREAKANHKQTEAALELAEDRAREIQRLIAQSYQETGRQQLLDGRPQEAMPYLIAARQKGQEGPPLRMLIWMAARSLPVIPLLEHQGWVRSAAFSLDGTRVVTASADKTARVWDAVTGKPLGPALEHQDWVWSATFSPDGMRVVTASADKTARVWDAATGRSDVDRT
jgi:WD domain, G-beta repeat